MNNKKPNKKSSTAKNSAATTKSAAAVKGGPLNPTELNSLAKVKWSSMTTDLKSAMGTWAETEQNKAAKSPEEEQLDKVRSLIEDLKDRLNEF